MHCKSRSMLVGKYTAENSTKKEAYVKGTVREQPKTEGCGWAANLIRCTSAPD